MENPLSVAVYIGESSHDQNCALDIFLFHSKIVIIGKVSYTESKVAGAPACLTCWHHLVQLRATN